MPAASSDILPGLYAAFASVVLFLLITAIFLGLGTTAQGVVAAGALGSGAAGFYTVARGLALPLAGALQFSRPWLWFTAWAALGLYDGRYQPMLAAALLAAGMCVSYLCGGGLALWRRRV